MAANKNMTVPTHLKRMARMMSRDFQKQVETYLSNYEELAAQVPRGAGANSRQWGTIPPPVGFGLGFKRTDNGRIELVARYYVRKKIRGQGIASRNLVPRIIGGLKTDVVELGTIAPIAGARRPRVNAKRQPIANEGGDRHVLDNGGERRHIEDNGGGRRHIPDVGGGRRHIHDDGGGRRFIPSAAVEDFAADGGLSTAEIKDLAARRSPAAKVAGGYSISPNDADKYPWAGTLACFVKGRGNKRYVLSNNHVLAGWSSLAANGSVVATQTVPLATPIGQPGFIDDDTRVNIGKLAAAIDIQLNGPINHADVALADLTLAQSDWDPNIRGIGKVEGPPIKPDERYPFQTVVKAGRTSGVTLGLIYDLDANFWLSWDDTNDAWFEHQLGIMGTAAQPEFSGPGDSGSLVVDYLTNRAVGLLFAGAEAGLTFLNPVEYVLSAFEKDPKIGPLTIL